MLYYLSLLFIQDFSYLNIFKYLTFRSGGALLTGLLFSFLFAPFIINWLKENQTDEYKKQTTQKEGVAGPVTGVKQKTLQMIFKAVGIKASDYMHGFKRGIFYADIYENGKEFLRGEIEEKDLKMKQKYNDDLLYLILENPSHGIISLLNNSGEFTFHPNDNFFGLDSFLFSVFFLVEQNLFICSKIISSCSFILCGFVIFNESFT